MALTPFDSTKYLTTPEAIAAYLDESAQIGDPSVMIAALATVARARNMSELARQAGITREGLYKALEPEKRPSFDTISKIANGLGLQVAFVPRTSSVDEGCVDTDVIARTGEPHDDGVLDLLEDLRERMSRASAGPTTAVELVNPRPAVSKRAPGGGVARPIPRKNAMPLTAKAARSRPATAKKAVA